MSLMAMNRVIKRFGVPIGISIAAIMIGGVVMSSFGNYQNQSGGSASYGGAAGATGDKPVATVGDEAVTNATLDDLVKNALDQQAQQAMMMGQPAPNPSAAQRAQMRFEALKAIQQQQALISAAKKAGVTVSDADVQAERENIWKKERGQFATMLGLPDTATDADIEREAATKKPGWTKQLALSSIPDSALRLKVYRDKWEETLKKDNPVTEAAVRRSYNDIRVRHILFKTGGALPDAQVKIKAEKVLKDILANPAQMPALANQYTEDPGSKGKGGLYDYAPAGQYVPEFTQGAFDAGVGKVNPNLIKTQFGYHIIKLEGERPGKDFPKDFDKNKEQYVQQYTDKQLMPKVQAAVTAETPNIKINVTDPLLQTFQLISEAIPTATPGAPPAAAPADRDAKLNAALAELAKVKKEDDPQGVVPQTKALIYTALKNNKEAIAALKDSLQYGETVETHMALAQAYLQEKDKASAIEQLNAAEKLAVVDINTQLQLSNLWQQAGDATRAKAAQAKLSEMFKRMSQQSQPVAPQPTPAKAATPAPNSSPAAK